MDDDGLVNDGVSSFLSDVAHVLVDSSCAGHRLSVVGRREGGILLKGQF
jgi:hypothetical protein